MSYSHFMFTDPDATCVSTGRNGDFLTTGVQTAVYDHGTTRTLVVQGLGRKGKAVRGDITLPLADVPALVESLGFHLRENGLVPSVAWWGQENPHHYFTHSDWKDCVYQNDTNLGYTEWVEYNLQQTRQELEELEEQLASVGGDDSCVQSEIDQKHSILSADGDEEFTDPDGDEIAGLRHIIQQRTLPTV